jgi:short-subunit dehydrogenase
MTSHPSTGRPLGLITGATAGLGRVFAQRLAARGHDLILVARDAGRLEELARELAARQGVAIESFAADLSRDDDVTRLIGRLGETRGLALLVNNAGFGTRGPLASTPPEPQAAMLHLHVLAPMRLTQASLPGMLARRSGAIINVSSIASFVYAPGSVNYCASKAYLTVFTEGLAAELVGSGVRVQALCPGFTRTEFHQRMGLDVASVRRRGPWLSAEYVVDTSLAAIDRGGPVVCIPGLRYRLVVGLIRLLPRRLLGYLARR